MESTLTQWCVRCNEDVILSKGRCPISRTNPGVLLSECARCGLRARRIFRSGVSRSMRQLLATPLAVDPDDVAMRVVNQE